MMHFRESRGLVVIGLIIISSLVFSQDPWPLERQDRYGSGCAIFGPDPATLTTPWISNKLAVGFPVSHGASIRADGIGYFGNWVDNKLFKFNTTNGAILGAFQASDFVACIPALGPNNMAIASTDSPSAKLYGVDTGIMDFNWFKSTGYVGGSPNIGPEGDCTFGTSAGVVSRHNSATGALVWSRNGFGPVNGTLVFNRNETAIIVANGTSVAALDWQTGQTAWSRNFGTRMARPGVAQNGTIVIGSDSGTIYGLDPGNGNVLWTWVALDKVTGAPAFSPNGQIAYVPSVDFRVYALRVSDGARMWSFATSMWCEHGPVVDTAGRIYVHNKNGDFYCLSPSGSQIWKVHLNGESRGPMSIGPDGTLYVGYTGANSALAVIRQKAILIPPVDLYMERGVITYGGLPQILVSDDDAARFGKSLVINTAERPIRAIVTTNSAYSPLASLAVKVESRANTPGLTKWLEVWNTLTLSWDQLATRSEGLNDSEMVGSISPASAYTTATGQITVRISWKDVGPVPQLNWQTSIDFVQFSTVPQFVP